MMKHDHCPECGVVFEKKSRSSAHHRLFFSAIATAYENWPETSDFQPEGAEHLRAYLLVRAGYSNQICHELYSPADVYQHADFAEKILRVVRNNGNYGFVSVSGGTSIVVKFPKSISFRKLSQADFKPIADACFEIIEQELGVNINNLIANTGVAA